jgi:uncharacterized surface protein with fasciclin (FAS1) repeats
MSKGNIFFFVAVSILTFVPAATAEPEFVDLADFSDSSLDKQWISVNDNVMRGVSEGGFRITDDKTLVFSGSISLENRGGFASIRSRPTDLKLDDYDTIAVRVKGDGRIYYLDLRTASQRPFGSYRAAVKTQKDAWKEVRIALKDFEYTAFGRRIPRSEALRAKNVQSVGFTLADKQSGPFRLEVSWIRGEKGTANAQPGPANQDNGLAGSKDIVDTAVSAGSFKTLVAAVKAAGLVDTLKGPGPFTVFAPTDDAFEQLPKGTLESLLKPQNKKKLADILTLHVVSGRLTAADVTSLPRANTVQGTDILFAVTPNSVRVDRAGVVKADIYATNGVIHVIDGVLLPKDVVETAAVAGQFQTLLAAAEAAGLVDALKAPDVALTIFAPTDKAFAALPAGTIEDLLKPENRDRLTAILKHHVLPKRVILTKQSVDTLQGDSLEVQAVGPVKVEEASIILADIVASNGVVHAIDTVLLPELPETTPARRAMRVIELAIERGVPLFNSGNPEACAAIYEVTARSLLTGHADALNDEDLKRLGKALNDIRKDHRPGKQAWVLRYALDDVYRSLRKREGS